MSSKAKLSKPRPVGKPKLTTARVYALLAFALGVYAAFALLRSVHWNLHREASHDSERLVHFFFHDAGKQVLAKGAWMVLL